MKNLLLIIVFGLMMVGCVEEAKKEAVQEDKTKNESTNTFGENFTLPDLNLDMIWVKPGSFMMGSPTTEAGRQADREDEHNVSLTRGFYLGKYEVTQAQYEAVMTGVTGDRNATPAVFMVTRTVQ